MSYSRISDHRAMVFDAWRNQAYLRALEKVVTPATTVMDLGAGLGVHGLNAARLGAARVLLVEPAPVVEVARQIAADNQLHNVACFPCRVEELGLQEKVESLGRCSTSSPRWMVSSMSSVFLRMITSHTPPAVLHPCEISR